MATITNSRVNSRGTLISIISYLSRYGCYFEAQKVIDTMRDNFFHIEHHLIFEKIELDMEEIYNLLRQNKVEALMRARDTIAFFRKPRELYPA